MMMLKGWKIYLGIGAVILALSGTVFAQHQRVQNLTTQRDFAQMELVVLRDTLTNIEQEKEEARERLLKREAERRLLYAEVNQLKRKITQLEDAAAVEWRNTAIPDSIRMLRENSLRQ